MVRKSQRVWIIFVGLFIALMAALAVPKKEEREVHAADLTISNETELQAFRNDVNNGNTYIGKTIVLSANITLTDAWGGSWSKIGDSSKPFKGIFNGQNYTISNVAIFTYANSDCQGFFGCVDSGGTIKNLNLQGVGIFSDDGFGSNYTSDNVGGICGLLKDGGQIENCTVAGSTTNNCIYGRHCVGGICGKNENKSGKDKIIRYCHTKSINVSATGQFVGGIVGDTSGEIRHCSNAGTISTTYTGEDAFAGGICGRTSLSTSSSASSSITVGYSSNVGNVTAPRDTVGGIVGGTSTTTVIGSCYNRGTISGASAIGGILGWGQGYSNSINHCYNSSTIIRTGSNAGNIGGSVSGTNVTADCYYNSSINNSGYLNSDGRYGNNGVGGTATTPSQFASGEITYHLNNDQNHALYGWYQNIDNDLNPHDDFPVLDNSHGTVYYGYKCESSTQTYSNFELYSIANQPHPGYNNGFCTKCGNYQACSGSGTSNNPYTIGNAGQLYWFACVVNDVNRDRCVGNPSANNTANAKLTSDITLNSNINDANARLWKPIGRYDGTLNHSFSGTFDGNNKTISGMKVNMTSGWSNTNYTYGGFFGHGSGTVKNLKITSSNVSVNCDITECFAGGLCGNANGIYENCDVDCSVYVNNSTGANHGVGGMFGVLNSNGRVNNCIAKGKVETANTNSGKNVGGFVGYLNGGNINNSSSTGTVIARHANSGNGFKVGGFAGFIEGGSVTNSGTTSSVTATDNNASTSDYQSSTGGFAGNAKDFTLIENCYAKGNVSLTSAYKGTVAGFIGFLHNSQTNSGTTYCNVKKCYATGNVTHTTSASFGACYTGGFVGDNWNQNTGSGTTFENCYAWGNCTFNQTSSSGSLNIYVGGFAANLSTPNNNTSYVRNCYAIGNVTASGSGTRYLGSLAGASSNVSFSNCYNLSSNTVSVGGYAYNGTPKNADAFSSGEVACRLNNTSGTDPVSGGTTWYQSIDNNLSPHDSYPVLNNERGIVYTGKICNSNDNFYTNDITYVDGHDFNANGFCTRCGKYQACQGSGASDDPYVVGNAGQLYWFACVVNGDSNNKCAVSPAVNTAACAKLTADITIPEKDPLNNSLLWNPIGNSSNAYSGMFDGYNNVISGMNVNINNSYAGFLGLMDNATVENVILEDVNVFGREQVGGICGYLTKGTISNCHIIESAPGKSLIKGSFKDIGGILGGSDENSSSKIIENCTNSSRVLLDGGSYTIGGIVGYASKITITGCSNNGIVDVQNSSQPSVYAGGIVGCSHNETIISKCYNKGDVTAQKEGERKNNVGGIIGGSNNSGTQINNSYNQGTITGNTGIGGILGCSGGIAVISNCYNSGIISGNNQNVGPIVGSISSVTVENSYYDSSIQTFEDNIFGTPKDASIFVKGEVTYLLNNNTSGGEIWRQNLKFENSSDYDSYPVLDSTHKKVYCAYKCGMSIESYTNTNPTDSNADAWSTTPMSHVFDDNCNGFCTRCGAYQACQGSGTNEDSYKIENAGQLYWFACVVNGGDDLENKCEIPSGQSSVSRNKAAYAELINDIVINEDISGENTRIWNPIGQHNYEEMYSISEGYIDAYKGVFDGNSHVVSGMKVNIQGTLYDVYAGLFGLVDGATIQNIGVVNSSVRGQSSTRSVYAGGLVGRASGRNLESGGSLPVSNTNNIINCYSEAQVQAQNSALLSSTGMTFGGGLVGAINYNINITNSYSTGDVNILALDLVRVGGFCGYIDIGNSSVNIKNCYATGNVTGVRLGGNDTVFGGFIGAQISIGENTECSISNCYSTGNINISNSNEEDIFAGGFMGAQVSVDGNTEFNISNCYSIGDINVENSSGEKHVGRFVGYNLNGIVIETNLYYCGDSTVTGATAVDNMGTSKSAAEFNNFAVKDLLQSYVDENSTSSNQLSSWVQAENSPEFGWNNHQLSTTISWNSLTFGYDPSTGSWATAEDDENGNKITFVNGSTGAKLRYTAEFNSPENSGITGEISHNGGNWTYEDTNTHTYPMVNSSDMTVNTNSRITTLSLSGEPNISGFDSTTESSPMEIGTITLTISG